jgi:AAA domain (dynein-related subfamily)
MDDLSENEALQSSAPSREDDITHGPGIEARESYAVLHTHERESFSMKVGQKEVGLNRAVVAATLDNSEIESDHMISHQQTSISENQILDLEEWDFLLPRVLPQQRLSTGVQDQNDAFNLYDLIGALQQGTGFDIIRGYLERFDKESVQRSINSEIEGFPAMFYVVESNNEPLLRLWIAYGGNPEAIHTRSNTPLLAFALVNSENIQKDTTLITATLLSLGSAPDVIPSEFYTPYLRDLPENGPGNEIRIAEDEQQECGTNWCVGAARRRVAKTVTLSQRYYLDKASKTKKPSQRYVQLAQRRNAEALLGLPYFLIGQTLASNLLLQRLLSHLIVPSKRPLVLVFAGPSGHGKTELARKLGHLLSLELEVVDCTIFNREMELFGSREPYVGSEKGSPLNNFLANNTGKRCIVFLDEFEKTTSDIHKTLLLPFDNGMFHNLVDFTGPV